MKVYIVERCYDYEGCSIDSVFSTRELAEARSLARNAEFGYTNELGPHGVAEWDVDEVPRTTDAPPTTTKGTP